MNDFSLKHDPLLGFEGLGSIPLPKLPLSAPTRMGNCLQEAFFTLLTTLGGDLIIKPRCVMHIFCLSRHSRIPPINDNYLVTKGTLIGLIAKRQQMS